MASAGCRLIPWDGTAGAVMQGEALGSVCLVAPSFPCPEKGMQPGWDCFFLLLYSLGTALLWMKVLWEKAGESGWDLC